MTVSAADLRHVEKIVFIGQSVTAHQDCDGWTLVGWEQGLPVHRKPATIDTVVALCNRFEVHFLEFNK